MKKLMVVVVILLVAVLMTQTVPDKEAHKEAMMKAIKEYVDEEAEKHSFSAKKMRLVQSTMNTKI